MKSTSLLFVSLLALGLVPYSNAQVEKPVKTEITVGKVLTTSIKHVQRLMLPLADAMPEDKYGFAPTNSGFKGVRNFGEQLKHVAGTNYAYASSILGEKPPVDPGEDGNGPTSLKTKADILKYLSDSFEYVNKAVATIDDKNLVAPIKNPFGQGDATRLAMTTLIIGHCFDHYGQMVEYLRMNGIVPPGSQ